MSFKKSAWKLLQCQMLELLWNKAIPLHLETTESIMHQGFRYFSSILLNTGSSMWAIIETEAKAAQRHRVSMFLERLHDNQWQTCKCNLCVYGVKVWNQKIRQETGSTVRHSIQLWKECKENFVRKRKKS